MGSGGEAEDHRINVPWKDGLKMSESFESFGIHHSQAFSSLFLFRKENVLFYPMT
jgi:hypothetical protein